MGVEFISLDTTSLYALMFIVLIGLPHGAFDGAIATHLAAKKSIFTAFKFFIFYCLTSLLVISLWLAFPGFILGVFLVISMIHFGWGDATAESGIPFFVQIVSHGGTPIFGIVYFHQAEVLPLFDILTFGASNIALLISELMAPLLLALIVFYAGLSMRNRLLRLRFAELLFMIALLAMLPPLVGFAFYFCIIHTSRHIKRIWYILISAASSKTLITNAAGYTIGSWLLGGSTYLWLSTGNVHAEILKIVFIGLAALTVPHMILVDGFLRNNKKGFPS